MEKHHINVKAKYIFSMAFIVCCLVGFLASPLNVYAFSAGASGAINNTVLYEYDVDKLDSMVVTAYSWYNTGYEFVDFYKTDGVVGADAKYFAIYVPIPFELNEGDVVNVGGSYIYSTGSISGGWVDIIDCPTYSASGLGHTYQSNQINLDDPVHVANGTYSFSSICDGGMTMNVDSNTSWLRIVLTGTMSSDNWFFNFKSLNISVKPSIDSIFEDTKFEDNQEEQIETSKNIFQTIGDIFTKITNLPGQIANSLSSFFTSLPTNIGNALSGFFDSVVGAVTDLGDGFDSSMNDLNESITGSLNSSSDSIKDSLDNLGNSNDSIKDSIENLDDLISSSGNFTANVLGDSIIFNYNVDSPTFYTYAYSGKGYFPVDFYKKNTNVIVDGNLPNYFIIAIPINIEIHPGDSVSVNGKYIYSTGTPSGLSFYLANSLPDASGQFSPYIISNYSNVDVSKLNSVYGVDFYTNTNMPLVANGSSNSTYLLMILHHKISSSDWFFKFNDLTLSVKRAPSFNQDFNSGSSDSGTNLDNLAGDLTVVKPQMSDVLSKILNNTTFTGTGNVAALLSMITIDERITQLILSSLSFGLVGLIFFGKR